MVLEKGQQSPYSKEFCATKEKNWPSTGVSCKEKTGPITKEKRGPLTPIPLLRSIKTAVINVTLASMLLHSMANSQASAYLTYFDSEGTSQKYFLIWLPRLEVQRVFLLPQKLSLFHLLCWFLLISLTCTFSARGIDTYLRLFRSKTQNPSSLFSFSPTPHSIHQKSPLVQTSKHIQQVMITVLTTTAQVKRLPHLSGVQMFQSNPLNGVSTFTFVP